MTGAPTRSTRLRLHPGKPLGTSAAERLSTEAHAATIGPAASMSPVRSNAQPGLSFFLGSTSKSIAIREKTRRSTARTCSLPPCRMGACLVLPGRLPFKCCAGCGARTVALPTGSIEAHIGCILVLPAEKRIVTLGGLAGSTSEYECRRFVPGTKIIEVEMRREGTQAPSIWPCTRRRCPRDPC